MFRLLLRSTSQHQSLLSFLLCPLITLQWVGWGWTRIGKGHGCDSWPQLAKGILHAMWGHAQQWVSVKKEQKGFGFQGWCCSEAGWALFCWWEVMSDYWFCITWFLSGFFHLLNVFILIYEFSCFFSSCSLAALLGKEGGWAVVWELCCWLWMLGAFSAGNFVSLNSSSARRWLPPRHVFICC